MVETALECHVEKFIYISTVDVFKAAPGDEYNEAVVDDAPKGTAYERSKQIADRLVYEAVAKGLRAISIHPAAVYGPGPSGSPGLNDLIEKIAKHQVPMVPPGLMPVVFSEDLASACLSAEKVAPIGSRYILSESCLEFGHLARIISEELGLKRTPKVMPLWMAQNDSGHWRMAMPAVDLAQVGGGMDGVEHGQVRAFHQYSRSTM